MRGAPGGLRLSRARRRQTLVFLAVLAACVGCDHATKRIAQDVLGGAPPVSFAADAVRFELVSNPGAFLSMGARLPEAVRRALFLFGVPLALLGVCAAVLGAGATGTAPRAALGLVTGGGLANWIDRLLHGGAVTDFVSIGLGPVRTGIFNVADVAIVAGVLILVASLGPAAPAEAEPGSPGSPG